MLLEASVPLSTALSLSNKGFKNQVLQRAFIEAEEGLMDGRHLAEPLGRCSALPRMFVELAAIGEETNSLEKTMRDSSDFYQKQLEQRLDTLMAIIEPASTLVVGVIVGIIAFSMFLPIYSGLNLFE